MNLPALKTPVAWDGAGSGKRRRHPSQTLPRILNSNLAFQSIMDSTCQGRRMEYILPYSFMA
jgi:hypothetical protein